MSNALENLAEATGKVVLAFHEGLADAIEYAWNHVGDTAKPESTDEYMARRREADDAKFAAFLEKQRLTGNGQGRTIQ